MTDKLQDQEDNGIIDEDNTQDPVEDEQQLVRVKEWINCCHRDTIDLTDVLSNFPDISVVLTEGLKANYHVQAVLQILSLCKHFFSFA
ncbi:hypothetical protein Fmac_013876 [Flemingia macrophylla]|uniref:Uncharacterized protein n=1 Tax=Flemingia macrophylla TaxID=520843 RepID=A0ABD1MA47_9FABA